MLHLHVFWIKLRLLLIFWVVVPTRKPNKVKLETQEKKDNILWDFLLQMPANIVGNIVIWHEGVSMATTELYI